MQDNEHDSRLMLVHRTSIRLRVYPDVTGLVEFKAVTTRKWSSKEPAVCLASSRSSYARWLLQVMAGKHHDKEVHFL
jgi:hypothetical protein